MTKPRPEAELRKVKSTAQRARSLSEERDYWIREAYRVGASTRTIAEAAGLSQARVAQIVKEEQ